MDLHIPEIQNDMKTFLETIDIDDAVNEKCKFMVHWECIDNRINVCIRCDFKNYGEYDLYPYQKISSIENIELPSDIFKKIEVISGSILDTFDEYIMNYAKEKNVTIKRLNNEMWQVL